jgi:rubredoxin
MADDTTKTWKCSNCGYTFDAKTLPEQCPACKQTCSFLDVSCYTPDCADGDMDKRIG